jgi:hypothetical protein
MLADAPLRQLAVARLDRVDQASVLLREPRWVTIYLIPRQREDEAHLPPQVLPNSKQASVLRKGDQTAVGKHIGFNEAG